ncbi:MAG: Uma2 family endonuclease [Oscillatoria sp. PMC 1068.18]|nr:Uma2 family endonuclease [Oscillatoria sp. PMC 1076.18]MEC4988567.1 Uma2 family endonuclease [Oscillatoria sp. PMC 1068.18]
MLRSDNSCNVFSLSSEIYDILTLFVTDLAANYPETLTFIVDPAPDLAIAIDITSSSLNRLRIYAALGVTEVWRFDGQELFIYVLQDQVYQVQEQSQVLSVLAKSDLLAFLSKRGEIGENALLRLFREWLRQEN